MTGAWRYTTVNCRRIWRWYAHVGSAQIVAAAAVGCIAIAGAELPAAPPASAPAAITLPDTSLWPGPIWRGELPAYGNPFEGGGYGPSGGGVGGAGGWVDLGGAVGGGGAVGVLVGGGVSDGLAGSVGGVQGVRVARVAYPDLSYVRDVSFDRGSVFGGPPALGVPVADTPTSSRGADTEIPEPSGLAVFLVGFGAALVGRAVFQRERLQ